MSDDKVVPIQPDPFPLSQHPTIRIEALESRCSELQSKLDRYRAALAEIVKGDTFGTFSGSQCIEIAQEALQEPPK